MIASESTWKLIRLKGKTAKGKNRVREWGDLWWITAGPRPVQFADGLHVAILAQKDFKMDKTFRWIRLQGDIDFDIIEHVGE